MTINITTSRNQYNGNDTTTSFDYTFKVLESDDLMVILTDTNVSPETSTVLTEDVDYSVSGAGDADGGSVSYPLSGDPLATGERLTILRATDLTQLVDFDNQGGYFAESIEDSVDKLTMIVQDHEQKLKQAVLADNDYTGTTPGDDLKEQFEENLSLEDTYRKSEEDEIHSTTVKATPVDADVLLIEDSEGSWAKKRITISSLPDNLTFNSPLTTKGDLLGYNTDNDRLPVGDDGQVLQADSSEALGVKWADKTASDADAVHINVANEISGIVAKAVVADNDILIIEDSEDSGNKKKITMSSLPTNPNAEDADAVHVNVPSEISAITAKSTPVVGDYIVIEDSENSNNKKSVTLNNLPMTPAVLAALGLKADDADLTAHEADTTNPHSVTQTQVGLSAVDNTSDADKPISDATQTALNAKAKDTTVFHSTSGGEFPDLPEKIIPSDNDYILLEDSEDNNYKKYIKVSNLVGYVSGEVILVDDSDNSLVDDEDNLLVAS